MGVATPSKKLFNSIPILIHTRNSMSEGYHHQSHQGIFSTNGFDVRSADQSAAGLHPSVYESAAAGTLSEMFNFAGAAPPELHPQISESAAAAMQLFLTDPQPRSPTPPPSTHMLLPGQAFHAISGHQPQFTWMPDAEGRGGGIVGGQGLSLSLSSTLEAAKAEEELRIGGGGMMFFGNSQEVLGGAPSSSTSFKNFGVQQNQNVMHLQGYGLSHHLSGHFGFGSSPATPASGLGMVTVLRNSKYARLAQELLEEFCSIGRGQIKKINKSSRNNSTATATTSTSGGGAGPSSASDPPPLSGADRMEHQRRKVKLIAMLDEVERRYRQYCEQMQMVVNSYDLVMGFGAAIPYTALAQKAMSRHFRCLKDAIQEQLKRSCSALGDKDVMGSAGITKGETPRLKLLEQSLRQQRAFHQMGMMEQEAWRPQRGLPERSVNILRAWLFEHFLHPYPSDADKHLLARQTGLSRNQVSNWFINARVRLWKPMVEEMYQQESKDDDDEDQDQEQEEEKNGGKNSAQNPMNSTATKTTPTTAGAMAAGKRSEINAPENDPSFIAINTTGDMIRSFSAQSQPLADSHGLGPSASYVDAHGGFGTGGTVGSTLISFGTNAPASTAAGDVSLTLGLRHSAAGGGNQQPEKSAFSFRDFAS